MATNFKLKRSAVASKRPGTTDLELGELALNTYDGFLYSETTGAGSTVSLLTPWQEKYGQDAIYYTGGNVGIGTSLSTTSSVLTVAPYNSTSGRNISIYTNGAVGNKAGLLFNSTSGTGNLAEIQAEYKGSNEGELVLSTSMQKRITIQKGGNVGIGSTIPIAELDVKGHTELDHVNVSGVTTHQDDVIINKDKELRFMRFADLKTRIEYNDTLNVTQIYNLADNLEIGYKPVKLNWLSGTVLQTKLGGINVTGDAETDTLHVSGISEFTGIGTFLGGASLLDNDVLYFGGSAATGITTDYRLRIYSDGTDSYISEATGAGDLRLSSDSRVEIRNAALNHTVASFNTGVGVTVFDRFKVSGISSFTGNVDLGISTSTTITATSRFDSDLVPSTDAARDLGSSSRRWRTLYVSNLVVAPGGPGFAGSNLTVNNLKVIGISTFLDHADFDSVSIGSTLNVAGVSTFNNNVHLLDDDKLQLGGTPGTVDGLELYHASNHSYIDDTGSGNLKVRSNNLRISNGGESKVYATFTPTVVDLYADNDVRLTTSGAGVTVTGIITATTGHFDSVTGPSTITIDPAAIGDNTGTVVIKGDLQVDGTTTTVNSTTLTVTDKNIEIAKGAGNDAAVDGAGITVDSTQGDKTWNWVDGTDAWTSSEHINVAAGKRLGFADDPNTFIDRPRADTIEFTTGGAERVSITGIGSVGIGSTMPAATVDIQAVSSSYPALNLGGGGSDNGDLTVNSGETLQIGHFNRNLSTFEERMRISSVGKVGIGSTDPQELLSIMANGPCGISLLDSGHGQAATTIKIGNTGKDLNITVPEDVLYTQTDGNYKINQNGSETFRITGSTGNVGINSTAPGGKLDVVGPVRFSNSGVHHTQTGVALAVRHGSNTNMRGNHLIIDDQPSGSGTYFIQATESTVSNNRNLVLQGYGGNVGVGSTIPEAKLSVTGIGTFKEDVYIDKKLYVGGIEIGGPGGPGIGTDITTRHLRATGITTTEQLLDADGGADIAGITTAALLDVGNLTNGRVVYVGSTSGRLVDSGNLTFDGSTLLVTGTLNSTVDVQINGTSVVDTALNDAVAMAIALG